jgi:hypothetical protein
MYRYVGQVEADSRQFVWDNGFKGLDNGKRGGWGVDSEQIVSVIHTRNMGHSLLRAL